MSRAKRPRRLACRYCGAAVDASTPDAASAFTHNHPAACPHRRDSVPALNGVHVGDLWRSIHGSAHYATSRVAEIRLGGTGSYTDREPVVILKHDDGSDHVTAWPLWCLVEHMEPVTRPDETPVPWKPDPRFGDGRSADAAWRCPGHRRADDADQDDDERERAYFQAWHVSRGYCTERWGEPWQIDPDAEASLFDAPAAAARPTVTPQPPAAAPETAAGEQLALL